MKKLIYLLAILLSSALFFGCSDPAPPPVIPGDGGGDANLDSDLDNDNDNDSDSDGEAGDADGPTDGDNDGTDDGDDDGEQEPRSCPGIMQNSCVADAFGCMGAIGAMQQCVSFGEASSAAYRESVQFANGAVIEYRIFQSDEGPREWRTAYGPDGDRCFQLIAIDEGPEPAAWRLLETGASHQIHLGDDRVRVDCDTGPDEICTKSRFLNAFSFHVDRSPGCQPFRPDDLCSFNSDCNAGEGCCVQEGGTIRQCLALDYCRSLQDPNPCNSTVDCPGDEICARCTRSGIRECMPREIVEDDINALGCVADSCTPGDGSCAGDRICCESAGVFGCILPQECSQAPDPNPICDPNSAQPCAAASQECCFANETQEFRCLSNIAFCQTNVCFSDVDCPGDEECCGVSAAQGTAGSCFPSCAPVIDTCESDSECVGDWVCCRYPGYQTGSCDVNPLDCPGAQTCQVDSDCAGGFTCCGEAPLTSPVCIDTNTTSCPPEPL